MELLKRNEFGQFKDDRVQKIQTDFEIMFNELCDKYAEVAPFDVSSVVDMCIGYFASRRTLEEKLKASKLEEM